MGKNRRDLLIAVALVIVFLFSLARNTVFRKKEALIKSGQTPQGLVDTVNHLAFLGWARRADAALAAQRAVGSKPWGRDPFFEEQSTSGLPGNIVLSGIVWDDKKPIAMVNEQVLTVGDTLQGYRITEIKPNAIVVSANEQEYEIPLFESTQSA